MTNTNEFGTINGATELSGPEQRKASKLMDTIRHWLGNYAKVGEALIELSGTENNNPLFIGEEFEAFCEVEFDLSRTKLYRLMRAARVIRNLESFDVLPATENTAEVLSGLKPEQQVAVWQAVIDSKDRPTIKFVTETRDSMFPKTGGGGATRSTYTEIKKTVADTMKRFGEVFGKLPKLNDVERAMLATEVGNLRAQLQKLELEISVPEKTAA